MKDEIQQLKKEKFSVLDELEAHKLTVSQIEYMHVTYSWIPREGVKFGLASFAVTTSIHTVRGKEFTCICIYIHMYPRRLQLSEKISKVNVKIVSKPIPRLQAWKQNTIIKYRL